MFSVLQFEKCQLFETGFFGQLVPVVFYSWEKRVLGGFWGWFLKSNFLFGKLFWIWYLGVVTPILVNLLISSSNRPCMLMKINFKVTKCLLPLPYWRFFSPVQSFSGEGQIVVPMIADRSALPKLLFPLVCSLSKLYSLFTQSFFLACMHSRNIYWWLLKGSHCIRCWEHRNEQNRQGPCTYGVYGLMGWIGIKEIISYKYVIANCRKDRKC